MKSLHQLILTAISVAFLTLGTAGATGLQQLDGAELATVTAGLCLKNCSQDPPAPKPPKPPVLESESWERVTERKSTPVMVNRRPESAVVNTKNVTVTQEREYNTNCTRYFTGGNVSIAAGLGVGFNTIIHCGEKLKYTFTLGPRVSATLYRGTMRYYITTTYRQVLRWSNGVREVTGLTATVREEYTYDVLYIDD